jgi:hypothetical protein
MDRAFAVLRSEISVLGPVLVAVILPVGVLSAYADRQAAGGSGSGSVFEVSLTTLGGHGAWVLVGVIVTLLWPALVAGPACRVAAASWYGRAIDRRTAARGLLRMPGYVLAVVVVDACIGVGSLVLLLPAIGVWVVAHLTLPVMVTEGTNPFRALGRSVQLCFRRFGRALLLVPLTGLLGLVVEVVLSLLPDAFVQALGIRFGFVVLAVGFTAVRLVTWTWSLIVLTLFTLDVRARTEGLDLLVRAGG